MPMCLQLEQADMKRSHLRWVRWSLSRKLLALTIGVIMLAQMLILVPAATRFRENWLRQHIQSAETTALLLQVITPDDLTAREWTRVFDTLFIYHISLKRNGLENYIALNEEIPDFPISLETTRSATRFSDIRDTLATLMHKGKRLIMLKDQSSFAGGEVEILILERPLYIELVDYIQQVLFSTFLITLCVGAALYAVLNLMFVRPLVRLNREIDRFRTAPETYTPEMGYLHNKDEIGALSRNFEALQKKISRAFKRKDYLATLGLAVAKISHDLRNILTAAQLMSDRMVMQTDPKTRDYLAQLVQTIDRAVELCQSTLMYGKLGSVTIEKQPVALNPLVYELSHTLALEQKGIALKADIPDEFTVLAEPEYLYRILLNLARNAVQAMAKSVEKTIIITARLDSEFAEINVQDSGPGIPAAIQAQLFTPFQSDAQDGTGLGLAIVKELVEAHGGTIACLPATEGAHFRIRLPART